MSKKKNGCGGCLVVLLAFPIGIFILGDYVFQPGPPLTAEQKIAKEEERVVKAEKKAAMRKSIGEKEDKDLDSFVAAMDEYGQGIVTSVEVEEKTATITVVDKWHHTNYQVRLQAAQDLWTIWRAITSPYKPDEARIELVDRNGNSVGGSRVWGGSLIWVQEN